MVIFGTALLAACYLLGVVTGDLLGFLVGTKTNIGGVGIGMMYLIAARILLHKTKLISRESENGVKFWAAMYVPVVIAMAAAQDVVTAMKGGPVAVLAAIGSVVLCAAVITFINRTSRPYTDADWAALDAARE